MSTNEKPREGEHEQVRVLYRAALRGGGSTAWARSLSNAERTTHVHYDAASDLVAITQRAQFVSAGIDLPPEIAERLILDLQEALAERRRCLADGGTAIEALAASEIGPAAADAIDQGRVAA